MNGQPASYYRNYYYYPFSTNVVLESGLNQVEIVATDAIGNPSSKILNVTLVPPPGIRICSPPNGAVVKEQPATVTGTVSIPDLATVTIDGVLATVQDGVFMAVVSLQEGSNTVVAVAKDSAGTPTTHQITVDVDSQGPEIIVISPTDGEWVSSSLFSAYVSYQDASGVSEVKWKINGSNMSLGALRVIDGINVWQIVARDTLGNESEKELLIYADLVRPVLSIVSPSSGTWIGASEVLVTGVVQDANLAGVTCNGIVATVSNQEFTAIVPLPDDGANTLTVEATDLADSKTTASVMVNRDFSPPLLTTYPRDGTTTWFAPRFKAEYQDVLSEIDTSTFSVKLDGTNISSLFSISATEATYQVPNSTPLTPGVHTFEMSIADTLGNVATESATITVHDSGSPVLTQLELERNIFIPGFNPYVPASSKLGIKFNLSKAASVSLVAKVVNGASVSTRVFADLQAGPNRIEWDGLGDENKMLKPDLYQLELTTTDSNGNSSAPYVVYVRVHF